MARYTDAVCRLCRREGMKLFLKGAKCFSDKCPIEKRNFAPGQHGKDRKAKIVGYGLQLREKQKAKRIYFTQEGQFRNYFEKAAQSQGVTGEKLAAATRAASRQRRLPAWVRPVAAPGAPVGASRPRCRQQPQGQHSFVRSERGRRDRDPREQQEAHRAGTGKRICQPRHARPAGWKWIATTTRRKCCRCRSAKIFSCRSTSS